jgi:hypothetical protein
MDAMTARVRSGITTANVNALRAAADEALAAHRDTGWIVAKLLGVFAASAVLAIEQGEPGLLAEIDTRVARLAEIARVE